MSNISFDNPWLLFIALPLLAAVIVPFCITVKRDNANFHNIASLSLHIIIVLCITLAVSGMMFETVITDTQVYVLADISYSAEHNLDDVQSNVNKVAGKLPKNSKMGVICFGRNYQLVSDLGESVPDIKSAKNVDRSATDIASVLRYAGNLFDEGVIKRIIVITDGVETVASNNIVKVVGNLQDSGVYVDAVFIDDNISSDIKELQIDSVEATSSTYQNKEEEVSVLVRANCGKDSAGKAIDSVNGYVSLYKDGVRTVRKTATFYNGLNVVTFPLETGDTGSFNYEVRVETDDPKCDFSPYNNNCFFTQKITDERKVLFIGGSAADVAAGKRIYGDDDVTYISDVAKIPLSVEEMCVYDEIALSNFDVRTLRANDMFLTSLTTLTNDYGKTLTTYGNTFVQEDDPDATDTPLKKFSELLPVRVGNYDQDSRLAAIVLDVSLSLNYAGRMALAKRAAIQLLNSFNNTDRVMCIGFSKIIDEFLPPTQLTARKVVIEKIEEKEMENGTALAYALKRTKEEVLKQRYHDKRVFIITDGVCDDFEEATSYVKEMTAQNVIVSAIGIIPGSYDSKLNAMINHGANVSEEAFYSGIDNENQINLVLKDVTDSLQDACIDEDGKVYDITVARPNEEVTAGVGDIGSVGGFWYSKAKTQAKVVLTAKYFRDKITSFDVPIYAYWDGGGKGKIVSFLSDISTDWAGDWANGTEGGKFLSNIPLATLPDERITSPFLVEVEGKGNSTTVNVQASNSLRTTDTFSATLTSPSGFVSTKNLTFNSSIYFANFSTDEPGVYKLHLSYENGGTKYEADNEFSVSYYAEYDSFSSYSKSYLYRLLSDNGEILELDEVRTLENSNSEYTSYMFNFTLPLMIVCAVLFVADIVIRQLKWKDVTSFFNGLFRRRR